VVTGLLNFTGSTVVITGAASGIGAAAAELFVLAGAEVHAVDVAPVTASVAVAAAYRCDLGDEASIGDLVDQLPGVVDALVNCAGVPNGGRFSPGEVIAINWLGLRELTETVLPLIPDGGSVVHVGSTAGRGWAANSEPLAELTALDSFADGVAWVGANAGVCGDGYAFSKQAVQYYTMWRSAQTLEAGVRMNSICPGVTNTALVEDFRRGVGDAVLDRATALAGRMAEPAEMAPALLFLADEASSSYINGVSLNVDRGTGAAHLLGTF